MKEIKYNGSLVEDIEIMSSCIKAIDVKACDMLVNISKIFIKSIVDITIAFFAGLVVPSVFEFNEIANIVIKLAAIVLVAIPTTNLIKETSSLVKYIKVKQRNTINKVRYFINNLPNEKKYVLSREDTLKRTKNNSISTRVFEGDKEIILDKENCDSQYIYISNRHEQIQILKQHRASLYMLEGKDVKNLQKRKVN